MPTRKYLKKVIVTDQAASAEARGQRLRRIRNMANLTRKQLCETPDLNLNTYKGWEQGRFGGLPIDGAERVLQCVAAANVMCTLDWLLYAKGPEPYIVPQAAAGLPQLDVSNVLKEIMLFQSFYPAAIYLQIADDALAPTYIPGDYVAGIRVYNNDINLILNQACIVQLASGETLCRYLRAGSVKNKYQLLATNIATNLNSPQHIDVNLNFAAAISRHYKPVV